MILYSIFRGPSLNRKDLRALTLVGPTRDNPVLDPLAVLHLYNQLFINGPLPGWNQCEQMALLNCGIVQEQPEMKYKQDPSYSDTGKKLHKTIDKIDSCKRRMA